MTDLRVKTAVEPDDGSDGIFWRDGARYIRHGERVTPMIDLAPNLEPLFVSQIQAFPFLLPLEHDAMTRSTQRA